MSERPRIVHCICILSEDVLSIRTSLSYNSNSSFTLFDPKNIPDFIPAKPIQFLGLLKSSEFRLRVVVFNDSGVQVIDKEFDSDSFGNFNIRIYVQESKSIQKILLFETMTNPGIHHLLGSYIPKQLTPPIKILISDFDKTLVDTKYSSPKEMILSLKNSIDFFPKVQSSIDLMKNYILEGYEPFIVSASPHFYEGAIRDWLYQNDIYTGNVFLKDYRSILSVFSGMLTTKDIKNQAFYKLNQIVTILLMTGIPDELVLMGDGFESDTIIYLSIMSIIKDRQDPWMVWNKLKKEEAFHLTKNQDVHFLNKFYQLKNLLDQKSCQTLKIDIRCRKGEDEVWRKKRLTHHFLDQLKEEVNFYPG